MIEENTKKLLCPKAGTATSFPAHRTTSQSDKYCQCNALDCYFGYFQLRHQLSLKQAQEDPKYAQKIGLH